MLPIKHILFPVDFSERCCSAVPFVEAFASRFGAKLTLISVVQPLYYAGVGEPVMIDSDEILADLQNRLNNTLLKEFAHLPVERTVKLGDPAREITEFAHNQRVDLIMMPTHGYGPFRRLLLGSVTAKVLHDADCPMWTAAHADEPPMRSHIQTKTIVCAVDLTPQSVGLMQWAAKLAANMGATLRIVHVAAAAEDPELEEKMRREAREKAGMLQNEAGVDAPLCVAVGNVADGVHEEARRHVADLVVIGRGVLHKTLGRLRTHSYGIIRHSPCPVLSV